MKNGDGINIRRVRTGLVKLHRKSSGNEEKGLGAGASPRSLVQAKAHMPGSACAVMPSLPRLC